MPTRSSLRSRGMVLHGEACLPERTGLRRLANRLAMRSRSEARAGARRDVRVLVFVVRVRVLLLFAAGRRLVGLFLLAAAGFLGILICCVRKF